MKTNYFKLGMITISRFQVLKESILTLCLNVLKFETDFI